MRALRVCALGLVSTLLLGACKFSVYDVPLPGGADVGDNPYSVTVEFRNVMDLVPQSSVKVDDVSVGRVSSIDLEGYTAQVEILIQGAVKLPANADAKLRQTSLLGEKFVSLSPPNDEAPRGRLSDGDVIPLQRTGRNPEVEEVLGALSLLLNGGGVAQLKTINDEFGNVLEGNETEAKHVLGELELLMAQLDRNKGAIIQAIEAVNRLAKATKEQTTAITSALDRMPLALQSLDAQRADLVKMLQALGRLSNVATKVIKASKEDTIRSLRSLDPILTQLANAGDALPRALPVLLPYPFPNAVVGQTIAEARNFHQGDYQNLSAMLDIDLADLQSNPGLPALPELSLPLSGGADNRKQSGGGGSGGGNDSPLGGDQGLLGGDQGPLDGLTGGGDNGPLSQGGGGSQADEKDDCALVVLLCRPAPWRQNAAEYTAAGYDPDLAALLLQGVNGR